MYKKAALTIEHCIILFIALVVALIFLSYAPLNAWHLPLHPAFAYGAEGYDRIASSSEMSKSVSIGKYGMIPIYGRDVEDGSYDIEVESSSSFFSVRKCRLTADKGNMTARMTMYSTSYEYIYLGTPEEAAAAPLEDYIAPRDHEGESTFNITVEALDKEIDCAAYSKKKQQWYPRKILFDADTLPASALKITLPDYDKIEEALDAQENSGDKSASDTNPAGDLISTNPVDIDMEDGTYSIQVQMTGGSGRASVTSPTWLVVKNGKAYARLMWSSSYYDYMLIGNKKYTNETDNGGNSTFTIPITYMDKSMPVIADTTAMGDPVEIEYELTFYSDTVGSKSQIPQEAAINVLIVSLIIIVAGGILNFIIKKRRKQ